MVINAGKVRRMSSSKGTKSLQDTASEIIKRIEPDEIMKIITVGYETTMEIRKDGISIRVVRKGTIASPWIEMSKENLTLVIVDEITPDTLDFWLNQFKNLLTAYKMRKL